MTANSGGIGPPSYRDCLTGFRVCRTPNIQWALVYDSGVPGHENERFMGKMSIYETTNAQFCQYLNAAKISGDITINGNLVYGASGSNSGADFVGQVYYDLTGVGYTYNGATNGGAARINYNGSLFTVVSGFENHPVTYVTWHAATAFCNFYGYRLPTEWEWQDVADYDETYGYGCGTTINNSIANYFGSTHPNGTTAVGAFGSYGYGICDMAGNLREWTTSDYYSYPGSPVYRGGAWCDNGAPCSVNYRRGSNTPITRTYDIGFRARR